ncbi:fimbria/pilus periplasmic chaperone [Pantoea sp. BAV 3049]|uniref:fimbria/pilus periplasmic chaperone n=1 Tax=Pantoea sp. BAV 3049 TaxID=2654188 RepID=UPI00131E832C|nr:fimbria/pilus periplasmic chaperone [Pantoea sp. BAV 3049]
MKIFRLMTLAAGVLAGLACAQQADAAIALDRTRVIFPEGGKSISVSIHNENTALPFLAQAWLEDTHGKKITSPFVVVPPLQRLEPGAASQLEIRALQQASTLPQDRESLFYFNLREIPPKSKEANTLQLALQTRVKFFYRPKSIQQTRTQMATPWQEQLTMTRQGDGYMVNNPTPYYISLVSAGAGVKSAQAKGFKPVMVEPKGSAPLGVSAAALGAAPTVVYINDYGGSKALTFSCAGSQCRVSKDESVKG